MSFNLYKYVFIPFFYMLHFFQTISRPINFIYPFILSSDFIYSSSISFSKFILRNYFDRSAKHGNWNIGEYAAFYDTQKEGTKFVS